MSQVLSGARRVLNDTVVNIHRSCQAYKDLLLQGVKVLQAIQLEGGRVDSTFEKLGKILRNMEYLLGKLKIHTDQLFWLSELNKDAPSPFLTWSYKEFSDVGNEIYRSYRMETSIKVKNAHCIYASVGQHPDQLNMCIISWTHPVYLISDAKFEAFLRECGLK